MAGVSDPGWSIEEIIGLLGRKAVCTTTRRSTLLPPFPFCDTITYVASLTLRIPDKLEKELAVESARRGLSKSDIARDAIVRHLRVQALGELREQLRPHLEAQGVFTEADVFKRLGEKL